MVGLAIRIKSKGRTIVCCLSQEAEDALAKQRELVAAGDTKALRQWRVEQHKAIEARREVSPVLNCLRRV